MTTTTFHDRSGKRFAVLELTAPAAPMRADCISFSLELDSDFGPRTLGGGDLSASDTIDLLKVMQGPTGIFRSTPINNYDNHLTVGAAGGLVTFTVLDRTLTRTIRKMSVTADEAREASRDLKASLTEPPLTATELMRASAGGDAGVRKMAASMLHDDQERPAPKNDVTWQERRIAELEQAVKERDAMIRILRDRLAGG